jgi:hypothetical protein
MTPHFSAQLDADATRSNNKAAAADFTIESPSALISRA